MGIFNKNKEKAEKQETGAKEKDRIERDVFSGNAGKTIRLNKISCTACGGTVSIEENQVLVTCKFCGNQFSVVKESPDFIIDRDVLVKYSGQSREVFVPGGVRAIGILAFMGQSALTKIVLPEGVTELQGTFFGCSKLETIVLPDSLEDIPRSCFTDCVNLKALVLPKNLKSIGDAAFSNCRSLTIIEIPKTVVSIEKTVFYNCENLETIVCYEKTKLRGDYFCGCESLTLLKVLCNETGKVISEKKIIQCGNGYHSKIKG